MNLDLHLNHCYERGKEADMGGWRGEGMTGGTNLVKDKYP